MHRIQAMLNGMTYRQIPELRHIKSSNREDIDAN